MTVLGTVVFVVTFAVLLVAWGHDTPHRRVRIGFPRPAYRPQAGPVRAVAGPGSLQSGSAAAQEHQTP